MLVDGVVMPSLSRQRDPDGDVGVALAAAQDAQELTVRVSMWVAVPALLVAVMATE
jgi:hypothetical protein